MSDEAGVIRWIFKDVDTNEQVIVPLNPKAMTTPTAARQMQYWVGGVVAGPAQSAGEQRMRALDAGAPTPPEWSFGGSIYTKAHYDLLLAWAMRGHLLRVTDHLGRTFEIIITKFDPVEKQRTKPDPALAWRANYTMSCLLLRELP